MPALHWLRLSLAVGNPLAQKSFLRTACVGHEPYPSPKYQNINPVNPSTPHSSGSIGNQVVGSDLLYCIEALSLDDLHLDNSHGHHFSFLVAFRCHRSTPRFETAALIIGCAPPYCLTPTSKVQLTSCTKIGNGDRGSPFSQLESVALHRMNPFSGDIQCGFDDALLLQYSCQHCPS